MNAAQRLTDSILSQASAHGHSQLKRQKVRVDSYTENVPVQGPTPNAKLAARVYHIVASSVLRRGQPDSEESCVVLQC